MKLRLLSLLAAAFFTVGCGAKKEPEKPVEPITITDVNLLGYAGENVSYGDGSAEIDSVKFQFIELGAYGSGMQMRTKNGKSSTIFNETALPKPIKQIKISVHDGKTGYANEHALKFAVGNSSAVDGGEVVWDSAVDVKDYTLDVAVKDCTFFKMVHSTTYSLYIDSISLVF